MVKDDVAIVERLSFFTFMYRVLVKRSEWIM